MRIGIIDAEIIGKKKHMKFEEARKFTGGV